MGIFDALSTAVAGLQTQSYAIENISGNIANSQTIGFKRVDTGFMDLIPSTPLSQQLAGSVSAFSVGTTQVQGEIKPGDLPTSMAISGKGFFVVEPKAGESDGQPTFAGIDQYTRRGDFQIDKNGFLVNGAGLYLKGVATDPTTGNPVGSVPNVIRVSSDFQPARATTTVNYRANLPSTPQTPAKLSGEAGGELLNASQDWTTNGPFKYADPRATPLGTGMVDAGDNTTFLNHSVDGGSLTLFDAKGSQVNLSLRWAKISSSSGASVWNLFYQVQNTASGQANTTQIWQNVGTNYIFNSAGTLIGGTAASTQSTAAVTLSAGGNATGASLVSALSNAPAAGDSFTITGASGTQTISFVASGGATVTGTTTTIGINQSVNAFSSALQTAVQAATGDTGATATFVGNQLKINLSDPTKSFTLANVTNTPLNAFKLTAATSSGTTGTAPSSINLGNITINGDTINSVTLNHGTGGVTQFEDPNGTVQETQINQDGFAAGQLTSVSVADGGKVTGTYSNGKTQILALVSIANFNNPDGLKRLNGGTFQATQASGLPAVGQSSNIIGGSVENSNVDIADEYSKLIVTQQAYTANTKVVTTADSMLQSALNMIR